jgi:BASS family bile acid:Na+ symporter
LILLEFLGRHATRFLFASVLVALALPGLAELARPFLVPGLIIPLVIALMRLEMGAALGYGRRVGLIALLSGWLLVISPVAMALATAPMGLPEGLRAGLVLMAAAPPLVSAPALAFILGLDAALAVVVVVVTTLLVPVSLPPLALGLLGLEVNLPIETLMARLGLLVGGPFALALLLRRLIPQGWIQKNGKRFDGVSVLSLMGFALGIMAGVTEVIRERPYFAAATVIAAFAANLILQAVGAAAALWLGRQPALTVGLATGNRNMGLVLVALADRGDPAILFFFAMAQFPMYMLPALLAPLYRRINARAGA